MIDRETIRELGECIVIFILIVFIVVGVIGIYKMLNIAII